MNTIYFTYPLTYILTPPSSITAEIDFLRHTANKAHQQAAALHASAVLIQQQQQVGGGRWVPKKAEDNTSNIEKSSASVTATADTTRTTSAASSATASAYASLTASKTPSASSLFVGNNDNDGDDSDTKASVLLSSPSLTAQNPMDVLDNWIVETNPVLDSLDNTVTFLVMAINRSQDYVKASGNVELTPVYETFSVLEVLATVKKVMDNQNAGRFVNTYPPIDMCTTLISDKHYLTENLLCLVSNASKYSDKGATIDVRVKLDRANDCQGLGESIVVPQTMTSQSSFVVLVTVEDTGIGISDEAKTALFQPFKQAQRRAGGTGLGLYSLAKRMEALGGSCGVRNREDGQQGSTFWFTFPYRPDVCTTPPDGNVSTPTNTVSQSFDALANANNNSESIAIESAPCPITISTPAATNPSANDTIEPGTTPSSYPTTPAIVTPVSGTPASTPSTGNHLLTLPPLRILLTDDSASILRVTKRFLTSNGHTVETCENGNQSLERLKAGPDDFDLLITDLQMPVMDGFESVTRYRAFEQTLPGGNRLFIMGMSANNDTQSRTEALETGMDVFVAKPFTYGNLVNILIGTKLGEAIAVKDNE